MFGGGIVGGRSAVTHDLLAAAIERAWRLQIDHAADAALFQFGQRGLVEIDAAEQFRGEDIIIEVTRRAADIGRRSHMDRCPIQGSHIVFRPQAADRDALAFIALAVTAQIDARNALQRFGDIGFRKFADVLGHDRIADNDGFLLQIDRLLQGRTEAGDDDFGRVIGGGCGAAPAQWRSSAGPARSAWWWLKDRSSSLFSPQSVFCGSRATHGVTPPQGADKPPVLV